MAVAVRRPRRRAAIPGRACVCISVQAGLNDLSLLLTEIHASLYILLDEWVLCLESRAQARKTNVMHG